MPERKRRICVVITARPSYSRIKTALEAIEAHPGLELQLVVAASALLDRYGTAANVIEAEGFTIAAKVYMMLEGENLVTSAKSTGIGLSELATVFDRLKPDIVVTIADRFETMATAVAASYMNIPLAHIQGGEVSGSIDDRVRHAITKLANYHLVSTKGAAERVARMGEDEATVHWTGCPSIDLAKAARDNPALHFDPFAKYTGVGPRPDLSRGYLVVLQHPVTTEYEGSRRQMDETLHAIKDWDLPTFWFWPNIDAGSDGASKAIRMFREEYDPPNIHFFKNMLPADFLRLMINSRCMIGNSSAGIRECSYLGTPVVNIGSRQRNRERGPNVIDADHDRHDIADAIRRQLAHGRYGGDTVYGDGRAGEAIAEALAAVPLVIDKVMTY